MNTLYFSGSGTPDLIVSGSFPPLLPLPTALKSIWLKPETISSFSDGAQIGLWPSSDGSSNDASQTTAGFKPICKLNQLNGYPSARFDGIDDRLTFVNDPNSPGSIFVVAKLLSTPGTYTPFIASNAMRFLSRTGGTNWGTYTSTSGGTDLNSGEDLIVGNWVLLTMTYRAPSAVNNLYRDGILKASGGGINAGIGLFNLIGAETAVNRYINADIVEIMGFFSFLSNPDIAQVVAHLKDKYKI